MKIVKITDQYNESKVHVFKFDNSNTTMYNQEICGAEFYDRDIAIVDRESFGYKKEFKDACLIRQWGLAEAV